MKTRLALVANNMQTSDPFYAYLDDHINQALRLLPLRASRLFPNYSLFPEHKDIEWTDVTVVDTNYLALPSDQIVIQRAYSLDSSSAPNLNNADWRELTWVSPKEFDQYEKPTTQEAYPSVFTLREGRIYFHPTPRTGYTTYVKIDGIQDEPELSADGDTPRMHSRWHPAILQLAAYFLFDDMGWAEQADRKLKAADEQISTIAASLVGLRHANTHRVMRVAGTPRGSR
jgi:hypothetical protein